MTHTVKFYAADLAAYNNGRLHGVWIDAESDEETMQAAISAMLRASPCPDTYTICPDCDGVGCAKCSANPGMVATAEEWLAHDYDDELGVISHLGETSDLGQIAQIMEAVQSIESDYPDHLLPLLFKWVADVETDPDMWADKLQDAFAGEWSGPEDYAADLAEDCGYLRDMPEALRGYIDFCAMARDMALGGEMDFICISTGSHLQDHGSMRGRECVALRCT